MKCADFENRMNDLLDDRLSPEADATLLAHADVCGDCREMLAAQENLFRGMAQLQRRTVAPELSSRVLTEVVIPAVPISFPANAAKQRSWLPILASAAAVLMAVGLGIWVANRGDRSSIANGGGGSKEQHNGLAIIKPGVNRPKVNPSVSPQPVSPQPVSPTNEAIVVTPKPVPPPAVVSPNAISPQGPDIDGAMATLATHWQSSAQWTHVETIDVEQYAPGIRPIRESFEVAIDALMKTIPAGKKETRPSPPQALQPSGGAVDIA